MQLFDIYMREYCVNVPVWDLANDLLHILQQLEKRTEPTLSLL